MRTLIEQANEFFHQKKYDEAVEAYKVALKNMPEMQGVIEQTIRIINDRKNRESIRSNFSKNTILFISHDASLTGAPAVLIQIATWFSYNSALKPIFLIGGEHSDRINEFEKLGPTLWLKDVAEFDKVSLRNFLQDHNIQIVYANSVASARLLQEVKNILGSTPLYVGHVHEKEGVLRHFLAESRYFAFNCDKYIFVSKDTQRDFLRLTKSKPLIDAKIIPPFIQVMPKEDGGVATSHVSEKMVKIYGCGTIEYRKGFDLFCETLAKLRKKRSDFEGIWIGPLGSQYDPSSVIAEFSATEYIKTIGRHDNPRSLYKKGDIFFLSSREDPFPLVALEAAERGLPILCFDCAVETIAKLIRDAGCGLVCRHLDTDDAAHCLEILLDNREMRLQMGSNGESFVKSNYLGSSLIPRIHDFVVTRASLNRTKKLKKILIVSLGPPPALGFKVVEGGGLRAWGLACGFSKLPEYEVTFSFPSWYEMTSSMNKYEGINIAQWDSERCLSEQARDHDILLVSYCAGSFTKAICDAKSPNQLLILDCYVPIHVEVCARNSDDIIREERHYATDSNSWNDSIMQADLILCANEEQKSYYIGMLCALKAITPASYNHLDNIIVAPFGINVSGKEDINPVDSNNAPAALTLKDREINLLWFGGVYPWFDMTLLFEAVRLLNEVINCKLTVVGAKNPFNNHPDFNNAANKVIELAKSNSYKNFLRIVDWVNYEERERWYHEADLIITINRQGIENRFSWRTRVADYLSSNARFVTNGGDPLSEMLIACGFAIRIDVSSAASIRDGILSALQSSNNVDYETLSRIKSQLSWAEICKKIHFSILKAERLDTYV